MRVVAWASQPGNKFKCVRTVKASHHGSRDSTPYELIRAFNPRRIVLMANTNAAGMPTRYGHPRTSFSPRVGPRRLDEYCPQRYEANASLSN